MGSAILQDVSAQIEDLRASVGLNALEIAINAGASVGQFVRGFSDPFTDESGVDTGSSSGQTYDAAGDRYHNPETESADRITGGESYTADSGTAANAADESTGTTWSSTNSGTVHWWQVDFGADRTITRYEIRNANNGGNVSQVRLLGSATGAFAGEETIVDVYAGAISGSPFARTATGSTGAFQHYRLEFTITAGVSIQNHIHRMFETIPAPAMDLRSDGQDLGSNRDAAWIVGLVDTTNSPTLNSDLTLEVSRDGGSSWAAADLEARGVYSGSIEIVAGKAELGAQGAYSDIRWRVQAAAGVTIPIHAISVQVD
jgi:hypothetical protein